MALSASQKGAIGQFAFLVTALTTGKGEIEVYTAAADNEGRDADVRRHLKPAPAIGVQVKITFSILTFPGGTRYIAFRFTLSEDHVQNDPRLWYLLAGFNAGQFNLDDPLFVVPAREFHKMALRGRRNGKVSFHMVASLSPTSRDRWSRYRVAPKDLGKRLLEIIDQTPLSVGNRSKELPPGSISVGRTRRLDAKSMRDRAA